MDPMDFTMDDSSNVLAGSTLRYQCRQPQAQSNPQTNGPNFASHGLAQARDTQHYDPVHESSAWYQHNHASFTSRPPTFPVAQSLSQWSSGPRTSESAPHWSHFAEMERRTQEFNPSEYRRSFMPWTNDSRGFEGLSHPAYAPPPVSTGNTGSTEPPLQFRPQTTLRGYAVDTQQQQQYLFSRDMARANIPPPSTMPSHSASSEHRPPQVSGTVSSSAEPSTTAPQPPTIAGLRSGFTRAARPNISRHEDILEGSRRRRLAASWDSDDDEESLAEIDRVEVARRHAAAAEALFGGDFDDDRSIAALRGAMAGGKRVPSKEALESLEIVKVAELKDADRTCIICYNEFGVSNPEGEIENPIRLPKCKHIFGDKCIKKWFEDSDSCPYCRDKLPSELAIRKSMGAYQSYRLAHREQLRLAALAQRSRYSYTTAGVSTLPLDMDNHRSSSAVQRAHEEYDYLLSRQSEGWGLSSPNRNPNADSPERRRQARGRHSAIRGPHFLGRPTSVGSARASNPSFSHPPPRNFADLYTPRRTTSSDAAAREARDARDRENRATLLASAVSPFRASWDQVNSEPSGHVSRTPPPPQSGSAVPHEEASPPVAVGSVISVTRQANQQQNPSISRLSVGSDNSDFMFDLPSDSRTLEGSSVDARNRHATMAIPSFGTPLGAGSDNAARRGPDSNGDDELTRMGRMDTSQIPSGWGSIN